MPGACWTSSDCTGGTSTPLKSRCVESPCGLVFHVAFDVRTQSVFLSHFAPPQDAHELFHVLTSSLEEERDRRPRVCHLFDIESLKVCAEFVRFEKTWKTYGI